MTTQIVTTKDRRRKGRWLRTIARRLNAMLGACVVVMCLALVQTWDAYSTERARRVEAEERLVRMQRAEAMRRLEDARWSTRFKREERGMQYEWRVRQVKGDS